MRTRRDAAAIVNAAGCSARSKKGGTRMNSNPGDERGTAGKTCTVHAQGAQKTIVCRPATQPLHLNHVLPQPTRLHHLLDRFRLFGPQIPCRRRVGWRHRRHWGRHDACLTPLIGHTCRPTTFGASQSSFHTMHTPARWATHPCPAMFAAGTVCQSGAQSVKGGLIVV